MRNYREFQGTPFGRQDVGEENLLDNSKQIPKQLDEKPAVRRKYTGARCIYIAASNVKPEFLHCHRLRPNLAPRFPFDCLFLIFSALKFA